MSPSSNVLSIAERWAIKKKKVQNEIEGVEEALREVEIKRNDLIVKRHVLETSIYNSRELARINIMRRAKKLDW